MKNKPDILIADDLSVFPHEYDAIHICETYKHLSNSFNHNIQRFIAAGTDCDEADPGVYINEISALFEDQSVVPEPVNCHNDQEMLHDVRGKIAVLNNAILLTAALPAGADRSAMVTLITTNLEDLTKVVDQICGETDRLPSRGKMMKILLNAARKLERSMECFEV